MCEIANVPGVTMARAIVRVSGTFKVALRCGEWSRCVKMLRCVEV